MTIAASPIAEAAIGLGAPTDGKSKAPPKRRAVAIADRELVPEPR